jgi:hypothetical protein
MWGTWLSGRKFDRQFSVLCSRFSDRAFEIISYFHLLMKTLLVVMVAAMTACGQSVHRGTWTGKGTATYSNAQGVPPVGCGPPLYLCSRTDKLSAPIPTAPNMGNLVGAGMCVNDPDFASKVCRITDSTTNPSTMVSGYGGDGDRNEFNTDSTKLFVESVNGPVYPMNFDPATMAATRMYGGWGLSISSPAWSHTNKDVFYGVAVGPNTAKYLKYDTSGGSIPTPTVAADFTGANCFNGTTPAFVFSAGVSNDDQIFVLGFSDSGGQGGDGAKYVAAYKVGSGCRMLNTVTGVISGDWGPTGAVPNWTAMTDSDGILLHSLAMSKDGAWISIVAHVPSCPTCGTNGNYFWQMATTNVVQPSGNLGGHITEGFTHWINGAGTIGQFQSRLYSDPGVRTGIIPTQNFPPLTYPYDLHVGWNNVDTNDTYPFCGTEYQPQSLTVPNVAWYKEIFCVSPIDGTVWRFAHTFDTSLSLRFSDTDAIGTVSQDGRFYMWSSDWMGTLGSENGVASCTVGGPVNGAGCRGDVFIVNLAGGGQTFYASPSGSDTNPGSLAQPVQTIPALKALVRNKPGSTAVLRAGTYALTLDNTCGAGLCLDSGDSGVTWESFPGEKAVLSGGTRLTGWVNTTGNQWTHTGAGLSDAEVLFYDGAFRYKPRLGSGSNVVGTQYRIAGVDNSCGGLCYDRFFYDPADTAVNGTWTNLNNSSAPCSGSASSYPVGDITITYMRDFNGSRARVKCRNATTHEIYLTGNITNNYGFAVGRRYSVENVENAAGTDTQWYWNKVTNIITYYAALGENPNTHEVIIPQTAPPLISATGLTNTTFQGADVLSR